MSSTGTVRGIVISNGYDNRFKFAKSAVPNLQDVDLASIAEPLGIKLDS